MLNCIINVMSGETVRNDEANPKQFFWVVSFNNAFPV